MKPFDEWLTGYIAWRAKAATLLGQDLPSETTLLLHEQQRLEPLRYEAENWRSDAVGYYYKRKRDTMEKLWDEVAKTALHDVAKAQAYKELWARENTHGIAEAIISRTFRVSAELKRLGAQ